MPQNQHLEIERECENTYRIFDARCCLDWDNELSIRKAHQKAVQAMEYVKEKYPQWGNIYKKYTSKINERFQSTLLNY